MRASQSGLCGGTTTGRSHDMASRVLGADRVCKQKMDGGKPADVAGTVIFGLYATSDHIYVITVKKETNHNQGTSESHLVNLGNVWNLGSGWKAVK